MFLLKKKHITFLKNVWRRFPHFMAFKCNITRVPHSQYQPLLTFLPSEVYPIGDTFNDLTFLNKLLNGLVLCPELLGFFFLIPMFYYVELDPRIYFMYTYRNQIMPLT